VADLLVAVLVMPLGAVYEVRSRFPCSMQGRTEGTNGWRRGRQFGPRDGMKNDFLAWKSGPHREEKGPF